MKSTTRSGRLFLLWVIAAVLFSGAFLTLYHRVKSGQFTSAFSIASAWVVEHYPLWHHGAPTTVSPKPKHLAIAAPEEEVKFEFYSTLPAMQVSITEPNNEEKHEL